VADQPVAFVQHGQLGGHRADVNTQIGFHRFS
jgi:hypothetical protein